MASDAFDAERRVTTIGSPPPQRGRVGLRQQSQSSTWPPPRRYVMEWTLELSHSDRVEFSSHSTYKNCKQRRDFSRQFARAGSFPLRLNVSPKQMPWVEPIRARIVETCSLYIAVAPQRGNNIHFIVHGRPHSRVWVVGSTAPNIHGLLEC